MSQPIENPHIRTHHVALGFAALSSITLSFCTVALLSERWPTLIDNRLLGPLFNKIAPIFPYVFVLSSWWGLISLTTIHITRRRVTHHETFKSVDESRSKYWARMAVKTTGFGLIGFWGGLMVYSTAASQFAGPYKLKDALRCLAMGTTMTAFIPATGLAIAYTGRR